MMTCHEMKFARSLGALGICLVLAACTGLPAPTAQQTSSGQPTPSLSPAPPVVTASPTVAPTPTDPGNGMGPGPGGVANDFVPVVERCVPSYPLGVPEFSISVFDVRTDPWHSPREDVSAYAIPEGEFLNPNIWLMVNSEWLQDNPGAQSPTVTWETLYGSAGAGDFAAKSGQETGGFVGWFTAFGGFTTIDDLVAEPTESFFVNLVGTTPPAVISPCDTIEIGVWDNDYASIAVAPTVSEGSGNAVTEVLVTVTFAFPQPGPVEVALYTADIETDSWSGNDFRFVEGSTRTLQPGQMSASFVIDIIGDDESEPDERFQVTAAANPATFADAFSMYKGTWSEAGPVTVTIIDDDPGNGSPGPSPSHTATPTGSATPTGTATATLTVIKDVDNRNGGTLGPGDFPLYVDGQPVTSGVPIQVAANVAHQITEDVQPGYTEPEYVGVCDAEGTAILRPGESATCTLLNNDKAPYIKLMKKVVNDDGGTAVPADWTLFATAAAPNNGRNRAVPGAPGVFNKVYAGVVYTLSESSVPGYTAGPWKCDGEDLPNVDNLTLELGQYVTCVITNDDEPPESACIVGWGLNDLGQGCRPAIDEYVAISAGGRHSLAVRADGTLVGWGDNTYGQRTPPAGNLFVDVAAGGRHSLALRSPLRSDGGIVGWGDNTYGQRTPPAGSFTAIAAGDRHSLGLRSDGSIAGWGDNTYGQRSPPAGNDFIAIAAGARHSLALHADGSIAGWGDNTYGQRTPPAGTGFIAIAAGGSHSLALRADGTIVGLGDNTYGQRTAPAGNDFIAIAAGGNHSLALRRDHSIVGWGDNAFGQRTPPAGADFNAIAAGDRHSLALSGLCRQPDGLVRTGTTAYLGNDIYNSLATSQSAAGSKVRGKTQAFSIAISNDGTMADRFRVAAAGTATTMYTITYWRGTTNITAAVVAGTYMTQLLASGEQYVITAKVKVNSTASVGSWVSRLVMLSSIASPATVDAVKFTLSRK